MRGIRQSSGSLSRRSQANSTTETAGSDTLTRKRSLIQIQYGPPVHNWRGQHFTAISHRVIAVQGSPRLDRDHNTSPSGRGETEAIAAADGTPRLGSGVAIRLDAAERRLLAQMPVHAITSVHGEAGLRERLLMEIAQFPAADRARAGDALALASRLHARDRRQREPYCNHLL